MASSGSESRSRSRSSSCAGDDHAAVPTSPLEEEVASPLAAALDRTAADVDPYVARLYVGAVVMLQERERRLAEAEELVVRLRGDVMLFRGQATAALAEVRRTASAAADATEARLRAEVEEWRRRGAEAEARLGSELACRGSPATGGVFPGFGGGIFHAGLQVPLDEVHGDLPHAANPVRAASPPAASTFQSDLMDEDVGLGFVNVVADEHHSNDDADAQEEHGRREEASSVVVSGKGKELLALDASKDKAVGCDDENNDSNTTLVFDNETSEYKPTLSSLPPSPRAVQERQRARKRKATCFKMGLRFPLSRMLLAPWSIDA